MTETELSALVDRVKALEAGVEDLMSGQAAGSTGLVAVAAEPELRVRISHTHTLKDGWRCDSTTVEWTGRSTPNWDAIRAELSNAHIVGAGEASVRNNGVGTPEAAAAQAVAA